MKWPVSLEMYGRHSLNLFLQPQLSMKEAAERGLPATQMIMCLMTWWKMSLWSCQHVCLDHQLHWMMMNVMVLHLPVLTRGPPHTCYHLHIIPTPLPRSPRHCNDLYTPIQVLRHRLPPPSKIYTLYTTPFQPVCNLYSPDNVPDFICTGIFHEKESRNHQHHPACRPSCLLTLKLCLISSFVSQD